MVDPGPGDPSCGHRPWSGDAAWISTRSTDAQLDSRTRLAFDLAPFCGICTRDANGMLRLFAVSGKRPTDSFIMEFIIEDAKLLLRTLREHSRLNKYSCVPGR